MAQQIGLRAVFGVDEWAQIGDVGGMASQYSLQLSAAEARALEEKLRHRPGFSAASRPYADFCFEAERVNVAYYPKKGKLLVQGAGADEFLEFVLLIDPAGGLLPGDASGSRPTAVGTVAGLVDTSPHFGVDESGKGDYFGPLVVAGVYSDERTAHELVRLGCRDSKSIADDRAIHRIAERVKSLPGIAFELICIGPKRYNELYAEMGNLNRLLAWAHARVIAALHEKVPSCPRALSDQFANEWVLKRALGQRRLPVKLEQRTKAESDVAVAAASILARDRFVSWMTETAAAAGCKIPLGCAPHVAKAAREFVAKHGAERLGDVAKLHFKTTAQVLRG